MNLAFRLKMAKQKGEAFLRDNGLERLPVDPFAIAASRDIVVKPMTGESDGVSGMLLRHGNSFGVLYATHIPNEGFHRFSVGHELGHFFLEGHIDHILPKDGTHASHAGFVSADPFELEADHFAAGLLMPSGPFGRALGNKEPGLAEIESLQSLCRTSLVATAIRYAELSRDAVAVIVSTGLTIDYCCLSELMKSLRQLTWLRKGSAVPNGTATAQVGGDPARVARAERAESDIDIMDWLGGVRSVVGKEEVTGLGRYGKALTVLTCPTMVDETYTDDEGEDEESIAESWTPRFRR